MPDTASDAAAIRQRILAEAEAQVAEGRRLGWGFNRLFGIELRTQDRLCLEGGCTREAAASLLINLRKMMAGASHA